MRRGQLTRSHTRHTQPDTATHSHTQPHTATHTTQTTQYVHPLPPPSHGHGQASGDTNQVYVLDTRRPDTALHVLRHEGVPESVNGVSAAWCHRNHATLVTGADDTFVRIWDVSLGEPQIACLSVRTPPPPSPPSPHPHAAPPPSPRTARRTARRTASSGRAWRLVHSSARARAPAPTHARLCAAARCTGAHFTRELRRCVVR